VNRAAKLQIPRILGISWWWLLVPYLFEWPVRKGLHVPSWIPPFQAWWLLGQMIWLKIAEPRSCALYWFLGFGLLYEIVVPFGTGVKLPAWADDPLTLAFFGAAFACIFVFRSELETHFNVTDPLGLDLSGIQPVLMLFVLNALFTQFHFHKLYKKQQRIYRSLSLV
jgi:hypothetical protein